MNTIGYIKKEFISPQMLRGFIILLLFTLIVQILGFVPSYMVGQLINGLQAGKGFDFVIFVVLIFLGHRIIKTSLNLFKEKYDLKKITFTFIEDFNRITLEKINNKPLSFFVNGDTSKQIRQIDKGLRGLRQLVYQSFFWFIPVMMMILITNIFLLFLYPVFGVLSLIVSVLYFFSLYFYWKFAKLKLKKFSDKESAKFGQYSDLIKNSVEIKIANGKEMHQKYIKNLKGLNDHGKKIWWKLFLIQTASFNVGEIGILLALLLAGWQVSNRELLIGDLAIIYFWFSRIVGNISNVTNMMNNAVSNIADVSNVIALLQRESTSICGDKKVWLAKNDISFEEVSFSYFKKEEHALQKVSLNIKKGEFTAFVGPSGAGKSTIFKMLLQGISPDSGRILIGDTDLKDVNSKILFSQIAYIPQEKLLFNSSLRFNVLLGLSDENISDLEIKEIFSRLGLSHLNDRLHRPIGENGRKLSGGERQRILFARVLLKKSANIILMDEPTSDLDSESEAMIRREVSRLRSLGMTIIMIAHRLTIVQDADKVFLLDGGKVISEGSHQVLVSESNVYKKMVQRQSLVV